MGKIKARALIISDDRDRWTQLGDIMRRSDGYAWTCDVLEAHETPTTSPAWRAVALYLYDVFIISVERQSVDFVVRLAEQGISRPLIIIEQEVSDVTRREAIRAGAVDALCFDQLTTTDFECALAHALTRRRVDALATYRADYERLLSIVSANFTNLEGREFDHGIAEVLALLGRFAGVDRSFLVLRDREHGVFRPAYEWRRDETPTSGQASILSASERDLEWLVEGARRGATVTLTDRITLAPSATAFGALLDRHAVGSLVGVPLMEGPSLAGILCLAGSHPSTGWHAEAASLLKVVAETLVAALQRQRDQSALIASEHRFRSLLEGLNEGVVHCDRDDVILHINPKACELLGYDVSDLVGERFDLLLVPPEDAAELRARTVRRLEGVAETYELRLRRRDGSVFWAEMNATPMRDPQGAIVGTLGGFIDITGRLAEREALRASEERLRHYFQNSLIGIAISGPNRRWIELNDYMCELHGYSHTELGKLTWTDLTHPDDVDYDLEQFKRLCSGEVDHYELDKRFIHKKGHIWYARLFVEAVRHPDGSLNYAIALAQDITAQKTAQRALLNQSGFLRQLIDSNPNLIFAFDAQGRFTLANRAFAELYGRSVEEIIGKTNSDLVSDVTRASNYDADNAAVLKTGKPIVINQDVVIDRRTGQERWFQALKSRLIAPDGRTSFILCTASEITERKRAEEESARLQRQLMQSHKMEAIGQLAAGIAHDLNNALAAVVGHLQLLVTEEPLSPTGARSLETALLGCERASALINQLLGFSRQGKYNPRVLSLRRIAEATLEFLGKVLDKDISIELGDEASESLVRGDAGQLQQVFTNLIINAKQAIQGRGTISLSFGRREVLSPERFNPNAHTGFFSTATIADSGEGIPPENLDKIFEPFFTTKAESEGSGLGLSMVYGIMQNHGGWIEVESTRGVGTTFTLFLPIASGDIAATGERPAPSPPRSARKQGHVLVIDDEVVLVELAKQFLTLAGFTVTGFSDPESALVWYQTAHQVVDMVILDMKMPRLDGSSAFRRIREIDPGARVVIMSGYSHDSAAQMLLDAGALHFFEKPLRYPELVNWITQAIGGPREHGGADSDSA